MEYCGAVHLVASTLVIKLKNFASVWHFGRRQFSQQYGVYANYESNAFFARSHGKIS